MWSDRPDERVIQLLITMTLAVITPATSGGDVPWLDVSSKMYAMDFHSHILAAQGLMIHGLSKDIRCHV